MNIEEIYKKYAGNVYSFLMSRTHDPEISEEVTQETFYQAIKSIDRFDGSSSVTTWLCAIAKNQLMTYLRKHRLTEPLETETEDGDTVSVLDKVACEASAEAKAVEEEERLELMKKLHLLKEPYREILYLRIFGELSFREIGEVFGKSENWARVSFYRGKESLRREIEHNE
ncbi:MAG: sigma-70 family RNA polymerase sigma factor [Lachnospiraceae bacterium]|nr:sigma-70 family RNA polymerase sigma factor [Lachnospiraceae bacterium]